MNEYVKCINSTYSHLTAGKVYEVLSRRVAVIRVIRVINDWGNPTVYPESRFTTATKQKETTGMNEYVRCIDSNRPHVHLTVGKVYDLINRDESHTTVINNLGHRDIFRSSRFEVVIKRKETTTTKRKHVICLPDSAAFDSTKWEVTRKNPLLIVRIGEVTGAILHESITSKAASLGIQLPTITNTDFDVKLFTDAVRQIKLAKWKGPKCVARIYVPEI